MADDDEEKPEFTFRPAVAARAANPELRRKLKERIRERENAGGAAGSDSDGGASERGKAGGAAGSDSDGGASERKRRRQLREENDGE